MSPLALLYTSVGRWSFWSRWLYDRCLSPGRILVARFCTFSKASISLTLCGLQTVWAYSRWLLIIDLYSNKNPGKSMFLKLRLTSPVIRFAVLILLNMWFSNWRSLSIRTPRSFSSVTAQRFWLSSWYVRLCESDHCNFCPPSLFYIYVHSVSITIYQST